MCRTRSAYHYAIRLTGIKKERDDIVKHRFATAMLGNKSRDFWAEVRKMSGKSAGTLTTVDGVFEPDKIAELFASKYQTLYSSVAYSTSDMEKWPHLGHMIN